ncbi:hypothetical protein Trydic_g14250 [Trypoxylus dichotomus]
MDWSSFSGISRNTVQPTRYPTPMNNQPQFKVEELFYQEDPYENEAAALDYNYNSEEFTHLLKQLDATLDLKTNRLLTRNAVIPIHSSKNQTQNQSQQIPPIEVNPLETESMVVNIDDEELEQLLHTDENIRLFSEEIQNLLNDLEHENDLLDTVNSNVEDGPPKSIPIQDEAINNKQQQIYVKTVHINPQPVKITIKDGKTIYHIQIAKKENSQLIQDFMKGYLQPKRKHYIMFDLEETYKQFCREYCNLFGQNGPEIIRCTKQLEVIEEEEERNRLIKNHHEGKTNHRGVTETLSYLQRRYYWNRMDTQLTNSFSMIVRTLSEIRTVLVFSRINIMHPSIIEPHLLLKDLTSITDFQSILPVDPTTVNIMVLESLIDIKAY